MNRLLASLLMIGVVVGMTGAGTWAYFSDTETSVSNGFTAGTLGLKLTDIDQGPLDGVTQTWSAGPIAPGAAPTSAWVDLTNDGTIAADHVEIDFAIGNVNAVTPVEIGADDTDIRDSIDVTTMSYSGTDLLAQTTSGTFDNFDLETADLNGNDDGIIQLNELDTVNLDSLGPAPAANSAAAETFTMAIQLQAATGNGNQGDMATLTLTFTLYQDASQ